ncbi:MAG: ATP-binding protein [Candidatus Omnitrophota bacterium]
MKINIQSKIIIIFCVILSVVLFGVFSYLESAFRGYAYERIRDSIIKETLLTKMFLEEIFPAYNDSAKMDKTAESAGKILGDRVTIIGLDGGVLGDSDVERAGLKNLENHLYRPEVQSALKSGTGESARFSTTIKKNMIYSAAVLGKDKPGAFVRLSLPLAEIDMISSRLRKILAVSLLIAFGIAVLVSFIAALFVSVPVKKMSMAAREIADGNFSKRISVGTGDELEDLAAAFNHMSEQINLKIGEVSSNRSRLEAVFLSMFDGIMVVDGRGYIILMNKALRELLSPGRDLSGKKPIEVLRNVEVQEIVDRVRELESGVESREVAILVPEEKTFLVHGTPVIRQGKAEGAVLVFHDITELRRLENVRRDFVANVSHELRTPAANIKGFTETLLDGALKDGENAENFVTIIKENSDRLVNLIEDLLELSRLESGKAALKLSRCSVRSMITRAAALFEKQAKDKDIRVKNETDEKLEIQADESLLLQVFWNLISNAVKYTDRGGTVSVSAGEKDGFVEINVTDNGLGIPEKDIPRIFERFYCVDKARSRELGGTGLGLSIARHIVSEHGGTISVKSSPGAGSTFTVRLPASPKY